MTGSIRDQQALLNTICSDLYTEDIQCGLSEDKARRQNDIVRTWGQYMVDQGLDITGIDHIAVIAVWKTGQSEVIPLVDGVSTLTPGVPSGMHRSTEPTRRAMISLEDAREQLPGPVMSLGALRKARDRDETFPRSRSRSGSSLLYDMEELVSWKAARMARHGLRTA